MARFCIATGQAPQVYTQLTRLERQAFYDVLDQIRRKSR